MLIDARFNDLTILLTASYDLRLNAQPVQHVLGLRPEFNGQYFPDPKATYILDNLRACTSSFVFIDVFCEFRFPGCCIIETKERRPSETVINQHIQVVF